MAEFTPLSIVATDGYKLTGRLYQSDSAKGTIIIAGATGVPQRFYSRFAMQSIQQGFNVVTVDYRGIGDSAPATLKGFEMDYRDWASKDLVAVIDEQAKEDLPLYLVGHSYGGHAIGMLSNHDKLNAAYTFGTGAGWHGWMPGLEKYKVSFMWNVIAPIVTRAKGYLGWSILGMGEDLPMGVYKQWKRWCRFPSYFFQDPQYPGMSERFEKVRLPIKAVNSIDDKWAMPQSRDAFMPYYRNAVLEMVDLNPKDHGLNQVGHMGYFFAKASGLWDDVFRYFERHH